MMNRRSQQLRESLKARVSATERATKASDLREIEDAFQYGEAGALELFDRMLHTGYSFYFIRTGFLNPARLINKDIEPSLTEANLRAVASIPGGAGLTEEGLNEIVRLIIDNPEDNVLIGSILKERRIIDPAKIMDIVTEQRKHAGAFSSGTL
jgi:hypothetical protein